MTQCRLRAGMLGSGTAATPPFGLSRLGNVDHSPSRTAVQAAPRVNVHYYLDNGRKFITRMNARDLVSRKATKSNEWLATQCVMYYKAAVRYDSHGKETCCKIDFGVMPVKLPWRDEELRLVVVKGFGKKPMMLLTNLAVDERLEAEGKDGTLRTYEALWQVVEGGVTGQKKTGPEK